MSRRLALLFVAAAAISLSCGDITIGPTPVARGCTLNRLTHFPPNATFNTNIEGGCPVLVSVAKNVNLGVDGTFDTFSSDDNVYPDYYLFTDYDAYQNFRGGNVYGSWTYDGRYRHLSASGDYLAAAAGFNITGGYSQADHLSNKVDSYYYGIVEAVVDASYDLGIAQVTIAGPTEVIGWEGFTLNADLHDPDFVPPVSYSWTRNGENIGVYSDILNWSGSAPDSNDDFTVTAVDLNGLTATQTQHVRTKNCTTPGCLDQ